MVSVVVAVVTVWVVKVPVDQVVDVIAVPDLLMPAIGPMDVLVVMAIAVMVGSALVRVRLADRDGGRWLI